MSGIDDLAAVVAGAEVDVHASPRQVWAVLADIAEWPAWNPVVRGVTLHGEPKSETTIPLAAGQEASTR